MLFKKQIPINKDNLIAKTYLNNLRLLKIKLKQTIRAFINHDVFRMGAIPIDKLRYIWCQQFVLITLLLSLFVYE